MTITIDASWLANAANGTAAGGWTLATANAAYQLAADVVASRSAFVLGAPGVTLDLNGHSITYNNEGALSVTNGDFSADAIGATAPSGGWNVAGVAGGATCWVADAAPFHMVPPGQSSAHVLQITWNPDAGQPDPYLVYGPIAVPTADRTYTVGVLASALNTATDAPPNRAYGIDLEVFNSSALSAQPTVRRSYAGNAGFGEGSWFTFYPDSGTTQVWVKISLTHSTSGSGAITAALSQLCITRSHDFGACATNTSAAELSDENIFSAQNTIGGRQGYPTAIANWSGPCGDNWQLYTGGGVITDSTCATATASISGGAVSAVAITAPGSGYTVAPKVTFSDNGSPTGRAATGTATISGGAVTGITITDPGAGYDQAPIVTIEARGTIQQGASKGHFCTPVFALNAVGSLTVRNVTLRASGPDTQGIDASTGTGGAGDTRTIDRVSMYFTGTPWITNRQALYCAINTANASTTSITGCVIVDAPQAGIKAGTNLVNSATGLAYATAISGNTQAPHELITNGYGLYPAGSQITVDHNSVIATATKGGRGLIVQVASNSTVYDTIAVSQNRLDIYELPNREAGGENGARGLEIRNLSSDGGAIRNITVGHNTFIAHASAGTQRHAYGARIPLNVPTSANASVQYNANISLSSNLFRGIVEDTVSGGTAYGLLVDQSDAQIGLSYSGNTYESNYTSLQLCGSNSAGGSAVADSTFTSETFLKSGLGDQTRPYTSIGLGYGAQTISNVKFWDSSYSGGATSAWAWAGTGAKTVYSGWLLTVDCVGPGGVPVAGAATTLADGSGATVHSGTTGSGGAAGPFGVSATRYSQATSDPAQIATTALGPHTLSATAAGLTAPAPQTFTLAADATRTLTFTAGNRPMSGPAGCPYFSTQYPGAGAAGSYTLMRVADGYYYDFAAADGGTGSGSFKATGWASKSKAVPDSAAPATVYRDWLQGYPGAGNPAALAAAGFSDGWYEVVFTPPSGGAPVVIALSCTQGDFQTTAVTVHARGLTTAYPIPGVPYNAAHFLMMAAASAAGKLDETSQPGKTLVSFPDGNGGWVGPYLTTNNQAGLRTPTLENLP